MDRNAAATTGHEGSIRAALGSIDRAWFLLALLDGATDSADEIRLTGEALLGFKQAMRDAVASLRKARETLEGVAYTPPKLAEAD